MRRWSTLLVLAWLAVASDAWASRRVDLAWTAPASCPSREAVLAQIERLAAGPGDASRPPLDARAEVTEHAPDRFELRLSLDGVERQLEGRTCAELGEATAVIVAIALDPEARAAPATKPREDISTTSLRLALRAFGALDVAALPAPSPGLGGAVGLSIDDLRIEAFGAWFSDQRALVASNGDAGADVRLVLGGLRGCYTVARDPLEIGACGGFEAGSLSASAVGVRSPGDGTALWLAPELGVVAAHPFTPQLAIVLDVSVLAPLGREHFELRDVGEVYRPRAVTARTTLGLEFRLP